MSKDFEKYEKIGQIGERVTQVLLAFNPFMLNWAPEACDNSETTNACKRLVIRTKPVEDSACYQDTLNSFQKKEVDLLVLSRNGEPYNIRNREISEEELDGSVIRMCEVKYQEACIGRQYGSQEIVTTFRKRVFGQMKKYVEQAQIDCNIEEWLRVGGEKLFVGKWINTIKNNSAQEVAQEMFSRKNNREVERMIRTAERWMVFVLPSINRSLPMMVIFMKDKDFIEAFEAKKHLFEKKPNGYLMQLSALPDGKYKVEFIAYSVEMDELVKEKGVGALLKEPTNANK